ncbi:hypothetical protein ACLHDF_17595 [Priestia aryabhattai]|uniref:hypothetical protein n=1 Tax=Priestia megaterium TaxID=1404 RepID=UPI0039B93D9C
MGVLIQFNEGIPSAKDRGGNITFYGEDPIVPSTLRLASAAAIALVAKSVAVSKI